MPQGDLRHHTEIPKSDSVKQNKCRNKEGVKLGQRENRLVKVRDIREELDTFKLDFGKWMKVF